MKVLRFENKQEFEKWKKTETRFFEYNETTTGKFIVILWRGHR